MFAIFTLRKSVMSRKFSPAILGPEMAAPILWAPGIFWFFLLANPHAHKIPAFRGGVGFFRRGGGGSANFIFMGVGIFPIRGSALLCSFAPFCSLLRALEDLRFFFALSCAHLRSFACICVFLGLTALSTTALGNCRKNPNF